MPDRVEMDGVQVKGVILLIADGVLPIVAPPDAALAPAESRRVSRLGRRQGFREGCLDRPPAAREIGVAAAPRAKPGAADVSTREAGRRLGLLRKRRLNRRRLKGAVLKGGGSCVVCAGRT